MYARFKFRKERACEIFHDYMGDPDTHSSTPTVLSLPFPLAREGSREEETVMLLLATAQRPRAPLIGTAGLIGGRAWVVRAWWVVVRALVEREIAWCCEAVSDF